MICLAIPNLTGNEAKYLQDCIDSTFVSSVGAYVDRFEESVAKISGGEKAVATCSGTTALHLSLTALGVERDDLVILPSYTFIASANAIAHCGAQPWLLDIDARSWTLDATSLERALADETSKIDGKLVHTPTGKRVAAIMPVYTLGQVADMDAINRIAKEYDLPVVADAACALGAKYKGRNIGELSDLSVYSFNGNKTFTAGGGGAIVGLDKELLNFCKHLSTTARVGLEYDHDHIGFNYRMTNINAAIACAQLERVEQFLAAKQRIFDRYTEELGRMVGLAPFPKPLWGEGTHWFSGVLVEGADWPSVKQCCKSLQDAGIQARTFWKPIHLQKPYEHAPRGDLSISKRIWDKVLTLPCSTGLTTVEQDYVIECVKHLSNRF